MNTRPPADPARESESASLNPSLKRAHDETYGPDQQGTDPLETISVKKDEGTAWPIIWASVTIICVLIALVLIFA